MFIGHFAVGLAGKKVAPQLNLGVLFAASQLLDLVWPVLVLAGVERVAVYPQATVVTPLDFVHYPFSHSLLMAVIYAILGFLITRRWLGSTRAAAVMGVVILSHWVLDYVTHRPDLPWSFGDSRAGLGLWNSLAGTLAVEVGLFLLGIAMYLRSVPPLTGKNKILFWTLIAFLALIYSANVFGPAPPENTPPAAIAGPALAMWLIVIWGYYADRHARKS